MLAQADLVDALRAVASPTGQLAELSRVDGALSALALRFDTLSPAHRMSYRITSDSAF
jgi:hypothetical protein